MKKMHTYIINNIKDAPGKTMEGDNKWGERIDTGNGGGTRTHTSSFNSNSGGGATTTHTLPLIDSSDVLSLVLPKAHRLTHNYRGKTKPDIFSSRVTDQRGLSFCRSLSGSYVCC